MSSNLELGSLEQQQHGSNDEKRAYPLAVGIAEAARLVSVSDDTIRREIDRGRLRAAKIGKIWRIRVKELEEYLKRSENVA
jgi:excisionase family DNA binding protein